MDQPQLIAHYRIIKHLGSGGFGDTFLAEDIHLPSSKIFVLKQLKPINNNPQIYQLVKERFQREAVILEELGNSHEQIPSLQAYFEENGKFYLVQEYIEGETLASLVQREGKQSEITVNSLLIQTLEILEFIQSKKIIHRDLKPDNIIIRKSDNKPVLIDFGAVRETMGTVMSSTGNSTNSIIIGTPGFMPSEQAIGRPVFSSDLYALGLTAIYVLTGKTPEDLTTDPLTGEIIWQDETLTLNPNLIQVLNRAIKSHSQERFITAKEMKLALISTSPNSMPTTISSPPNYPPTSPPNQKKLTWLWIILTLLAIIGMLAAIALPSFIAKRNKIKRVEAQNQISEINKAQVNNFLEKGKFSDSFQDLDLDFSLDSKSYEYQVQLLDTNRVIVLAIPKHKGLRSIIGVTFINSDQIIDGICVSKNNSLQAPIIPNLTDSNFQCSNDSELLSNTNSTPVPEKFIPRPSPEQAIIKYYDTLNKENYQDGWYSLSPKLRNNFTLHPKGFNSYLEWWTQVAYVNVLNTRLISQDPYNSVILTDLRYRLQSGRIINQTLEFDFIWDSERKQWLINRVQRQ